MSNDSQDPHIDPRKSGSRTLLVAAVIGLVAVVAVLGVALATKSSPQAKVSLAATHGVIKGDPSTTTATPSTTTTAAPSTTTTPSNQALDQCAGCDGSGSGPGVGSGTSTVTPEQQFAIDVRPDPLVAGGTIGDSIDAGQLNNSAIGAIGDDVCNDFSFWTSPPYNSSIPYMDEVIQLEHGVTAKVHLSFSLDQSAAETFVSEAITDICSSQQSIIPYGDPGAA